MRMSRCGRSDCWWGPVGGWTTFRRKRRIRSGGSDCWPGRGGSNCAVRKRWRLLIVPAACSAWIAPGAGRVRERRTPAPDWWRCRPGRACAATCSAGKRPSSAGQCCSWWAKGVPRTAGGRREFGSAHRHYTTPFSNKVNKPFTPFVL